MHGRGKDQSRSSAASANSVDVTFLLTEVGGGTRVAVIMSVTRGRKNHHRLLLGVVLLVAFGVCTPRPSHAVVIEACSRVQNAHASCCADHSREGIGASCCMEMCASRAVGSEHHAGTQSRATSFADRVSPSCGCSWSSQPTAPPSATLVDSQLVFLRFKPSQGWCDAFCAHWPASTARAREAAIKNAGETDVRRAAPSFILFCSLLI